MENLLTSNHKEISFIKIFYRILLVFSLLVSAGLGVLSINDTVIFNSGEIIAQVPQVDYKAPFEGEPQKVFVKEGQSVKAGDTLLILNNETVRKNHQSALTNYSAIQETHEAIIALITSAHDKIKNLKREKYLNLKEYQSEKDKMGNDYNLATQKAALYKEKLTSVALSKLQVDSALYEEKVISKFDLTKSLDTYLDYKNTVIDAEGAVDQTQAGLAKLENDYLQTQNSLDLKLIELNERIKELTREKAKAENDLKKAQEDLDFNQSEAAKQYLISDLNGEVLNLYNLRFTQNFVNKGDLLLSVVPQKDSYYAKVIIPQRDIRQIKIGQRAHLKVDAFNYLDKGVLEGKVSYIPERKPKEEFFIIIALEPHPDFQLKGGFSIEGEIIIENLKIYQYILKKLFRSFQGAS